MDIHSKLKSVLINFLVGGTVVATVSVFATWMSPVAGAIWWSFPLSIIPSIYFLRYHGKSNQYVSVFLRSTTYAISLLVLATLIMSYYFSKLKPYDEEWSIAIIKTVGWWILLSAIFYIIVSKFGWDKWFMID
tara:strand:+ start:1268 stop:1666 length:399 start_codon:yes stop_codon:yes gene_type:complete